MTEPSVVVCVHILQRGLEVVGVSHGSYDYRDGVCSAYGAVRDFWVEERGEFNIHHQVLGAKYFGRDSARRRGETEQRRYYERVARLGCE